MITKRKTAFYLTHFILLIAQASIALLLLLLAPTEEKNAIFLGYSFGKLLLLSFPFIVLLSGFALLIRYRSPSQLNIIDHFLDQRLKPAVTNWIITFCLFLILAGIYSLTVLRWESIFVVAPPEEGIEIPIHIYHMGVSFDRIEFYLQRLLPIIYLVIGLCIQILIFFAGFRKDWDAWKEKIRSHEFIKIFLVYGFFLILWGFLAWGLKQFEPDFDGYSWQMFGAMILDSDVLFTFVIGILLIGIGAAGKALGLGSRFFRMTQSSKRDRNFDIVVGLIIWLIAAVFWLSLSIEPNWFVFEPRYPNFEYYPRDDALKYDITGQNMLLGADLLLYGHVMHKPFYAAFLALLHAIAGPDFERITLLQSAIFAVFPSLIYLLTKRLHSRLAGIIAALLVIFRDANAIVLSPRINVSHSRQLVTETPAAIGIMLVILMIFVWIDDPNKNILRTMLIGGVIGLLTHVRNELIFLLPVIVFFSIYIYFRFPRYWLKTSALLAIGVFLFMIPWQIRIVHFTGSSFWMSRRADFILKRLETDPAVSTNLPQENLDSKIENQWGFLQYFPSHFVHNQIQAFLIFPDAYRLVDSLLGYSVHGNADRFWNDCCSAGNYVDRLFEFWRSDEWDGNVKKESLPAILTTLFFISVGVVKSRDKLGVRALFPLLIVFAYYLLLSNYRMSGGRRVQVVDWIWIIYFSIGLGQFALWLFHFLFSVEVPTWLAGKQKGRSGDFVTRQTLISPNNPSLNWKSILLVSLSVLFFGAMVPIIEQIIPARYTEKTLQSQIEKVLMLENGELISDIFTNGGGALQGKALYPRYYAAGEGDDNMSIPYDQLRFFLAGPDSYQIVLPLTDKQEFVLPNYSDVLVVGCADENLNPLAIYIEDENYILFRDPFPEKVNCPISNN
jgi:hypothetical protein